MQTTWYESDGAEVRKIQEAKKIQVHCHKGNVSLNAISEYGRVKVWLHSFLTSTLNKTIGQLQAPATLCPGKPTDFGAGRMRERVWGVLEKRKFSSTGIRAKDLPDRRYSHYTDYITAAPHSPNIYLRNIFKSSTQFPLLFSENN
jgi:hypothetical protein